jgi:hypothetical protein
VNCIDQNLNNEIYIIMYSKKTLSSSSIWSLNNNHKNFFCSTSFKQKTFCFYSKKKRIKKIFCWKIFDFLSIVRWAKIKFITSILWKYPREKLYTSIYVNFSFFPCFFLYQHCKHVILHYLKPRVFFGGKRLKNSLQIISFF